MTNKKIKNIDFFSIFLLLGPILDVMSFLEVGGKFSVSIIVRTLFLGFLILLLLRKKEIYLELGLVLLVSAFLFGFSYYILKQGFVVCLSSILKLIYLPIVLLYFKNYTWDSDKMKTLEIVLFMYLSIFLLSYVTGIGSNAYLETDGKSGFKGLFSSINEFSAIVVSLLFLVGTFLKKNKNYIRLSILILFSLITSLLIGTKVLLGGILFTLLYFIYLDRKKIFFNQKVQVKVLICIISLVFLIGGGFLFTKTRTYQNMKIQQNFFHADRVFSYEFLNRVVFNDRLTFLEENFEFYKEQDISKKLLGIGIGEYEVKMVEIDIFDLLFRYGMIGVSLFMFIFIFRMGFQSMNIEALISSILLILISCTSGHVLFYPAVTIYFGCFSTMKRGAKEQRLK